MRVYFQMNTAFHVCFGCSVVLQSRPSSLKSPLLCVGFAKKDAAFHPYRWLQSAGTHDFVNERYFYKNIQFKHFCAERMYISKYLKGRLWGRGWHGKNNLEIWTSSIPVHPLLPFPPSLFRSPSCLALWNVFLVVSLNACNSQHAWSAYFLHSKTTQNKTQFRFFPSQQCSSFPESYWNLINSHMRKTYNSICPYVLSTLWEWLS